MPTTPYPKILAFVEGTMERIFLNNNFSYVEVIPLSNGDSWGTERMCEQVARLYRMKQVFPDHIVVWFDREKNPDGSQQISESVRKSLADEGFPEQNVHCLIPDRMTENLILADELLIRSEIGEPSYVYCNEGENGKAILKNLLYKIKRNYRETIDGPSLLKKLRLKNAKQNSIGASIFLSTFQYDCWWI